MKRALGLLLTLCLLLGCVAPAFAAITISEQPVTQTVKENGKVTFSFKVKGQKSITWIFVNPETGEEITGKNLSKAVKGVKVANPNSKNITLKKVPASMHGWSVFARCKSSGVTVETDVVQLLIEGMEAPEAPAARTVEVQEPENGEQAGQAEQDAQGEAAGEEVPDEEASGEEASGEEASGEEAEASPSENTADAQEGVEADPEQQSQVTEPEPEPEPEPVVITAKNSVLLYQVDAKGNPVGDPVDSLTFEPGSTATFHVKAAEEGEIQYWQIGDMRVTPMEQISGLTLKGIEESASVSVKQRKVTASTANLDYTNMCKITCTNCFFTFLPDGITYASEGEVPAGAKITVIAAQGANLLKGYTVNGEPGQQKNKVTFSFVVEADAEFSMQQQP